MTFAEARIAGLAFTAVTLTIAVNLFAFQERRPSRIETSSLSPVRSTIAALEPAAGAPHGQGGAGGAARIEPITGAIEAVKPQAPVAATPGVTQAEIIRGVQRELSARGYAAGQPDGIAGLVTRAAIMAYEHDYGLALTGEASEELLNRIVLGSSADADTMRAGPDVILSAEAKAVVRMVTQNLSGLGYKPGNDATSLTAETRRAILAFEAAQNLPETGRISAPLVSRLMKLQAQAPSAAAAIGRTRAAQK